MVGMKEFDIVDVVKSMKPKCIVELGTGDGYTAARIMEALLPDATLTTINWTNPPSGDHPYRYLLKWLQDKRLHLIYGDTRDSVVFERVPDCIDLLHIDSTHTADCANAEWSLYHPKLVDGAFVVVDDLDHNDMMSFWKLLPYNKTTERDGKMGVFTYNRSRA